MQCCFVPKRNQISSCCKIIFCMFKHTLSHRGYNKSNLCKLNIELASFCKYYHPKVYSFYFIFYVVILKQIQEIFILSLFARN